MSADHISVTNATYFPPKADGTPEQCPICHDWYVKPVGVSISCCVMHGPGECCHMGETKVDPPVWDAGLADTEPPDLPPEIEDAWLEYGVAVTHSNRVAWNDVRGFEEALGDAPTRLRQAIADALAELQAENARLLQQLTDEQNAHALTGKALRRDVRWQAREAEYQRRIAELERVTLPLRTIG